MLHKKLPSTDDTPCFFAFLFTDCKPGWMAYGSSSHSCIKIENSKSYNFWEVDAYCARNTAQMITITSMSELQQIRTAVSFADMY